MCVGVCVLFLLPSPQKGDTPTLNTECLLLIFYFSQISLSVLSLPSSTKAGQDMDHRIQVTISLDFFKIYYIRCISSHFPDFLINIYFNWRITSSAAVSLNSPQFASWLCPDVGRLDGFPEHGAALAVDPQGMGTDGDLIPVHRKQTPSVGVVDAKSRRQALELIVSQK